jgi:acyl-CoA reductase-like NAD-dependent aldehyde dehydrogenase
MASWNFPVLHFGYNHKYFGNKISVSASHLCNIKYKQVTAVKTNILKIKTQKKVMETTQKVNRLNEAVVDYLSKGPRLLLIDGKWVPAVSGRTLETVNPATEDVLTTIAEGGKEDVDLAVKAARRAFESPAWANISAHERERYLHRIADLIELNAEELAVLESLDNGMPAWIAKWLVTSAAQTFRYYAGWPTKIYGKTNPTDGSSFTYTLREPLGVCGAIVPWNGPSQSAAWKIAPAIAFGNTVVIKPSQLTSLTLLRIGELIVESGLPPGVVNIVTGKGPAVGNALVEHPDVDKIAFTGSTGVGKGIVKATADTLKKVTLELGGKSPNIIFPDADLEKAVQAAVNGFTQNSGQGCVAGSRVFVHESIYEQVKDRVIVIAESLKIGNGFDPDTQMGPITSKDQLEKILGYVKLGQQEGATLATGGNRIPGKGYFMQPTVFTNVKNNMRLAQEEIFGPVVVLIPFKDETDAVLQANDSEFGLAACVWTKDINIAHRVAGKLKAGTVWVNTIFEMDPIFPFGGYKQSGLGRELGAESVDAYTQIKSVVVRYGLPVSAITETYSLNQ